jgi:hypothetical protein
MYALVTIKRVEPLISLLFWRISPVLLHQRPERSTSMSVEDLEQGPMMNHMLEALDRGEDIGRYGRLTFVMVARHFVDNEELVGL